MRRRAALLFLLAAACSNRRVVSRLEEEATRAPRTEADALLDGPTRPVTWKTRAAATTLPLVSDALPGVTGRINGTPMRVLLDTGTSGVLLTGAAAERVRPYLPRRDPVMAVSPGHEQPLREGVVESIGLGPFGFGRARVVVPLRRGAYRPWTGSRPDEYAIVGCSVLSHFRVTFDFAAREVRLVPHGQPADPRPLFATVRINGRPYRLLVDSGARHVFLEPWAARELGLVDEARADELGRKASRADEARIAWTRVETLEVAALRRERVAVGVVSTFGEGRSGARPAGLLGLAAFGRLAWTVDFAERRILVLASRP